MAYWSFPPDPGEGALESATKGTGEQLVAEDRATAQLCQAAARAALTPSVTSAPGHAGSDVTHRGVHRTPAARRSDATAGKPSCQKS
jgi:hypothetical protein